MKKTKVLPVIHHLNRATSLEEAQKARDCGADGVFLISHMGDDIELLAVAAAVRLALPGFPVGVNLLSTGALAAVGWASDMNLPMLWLDSAGVSSDGLTSLGQAVSALAVDAVQTGGTLEIFGSVAFKYQAPEPKPGLAARHAKNAGFIATTSGPGTGHAPSLDKVQCMSAQTQGILALASGITPVNVMVYAPYVSHILVATGIAISEHCMDTSKLKALITNAAH